MIKKVILLLVLLINRFALTNTTIYIVPFPGSENDIIFCDPYNPKSDGSNAFCKLLRSFIDHGFKTKVAKSLKNLPDVAYIICFNMPLHIPGAMQDLRHYPRNKCWVSLWEPPVTAPEYYDPSNLELFGKVFTLFDDMVDNKKFYKFYYPQGTLSMISQPVPFEKKKLCTTVIGNKQSTHPCELYSARKRTIDFFEKIRTHDFDFYGSGWPAHSYKNYKSPISSKIDCIKNYKFCICYENMHNQRGYITEKIFDAMIAGVIPIYWGAKNITDYIPADCFIAREKFENDQQLYDYIKKMDQYTYSLYIQHIKAFLSSEKAYFFSKQSFIKTFVKALEK
jgi:hypothetical protein